MQGEKSVQGHSNCFNSPQVIGEAIAEHLYIKFCKNIIALYVVEQSKLRFITPSAGFLPASWMHEVSGPTSISPQSELSAPFQKGL